MIKTQKRMTWCIILLCANLLFIWGNSLMVRDISSAISKAVGAIIRWLFSGSEDLVEGAGQGLLRKLAHFTEFFTLGMLLTWLVGMLSDVKWKRYLLPALAGLAVACIDETIQIFVPGRGPGVLDVTIDFSGVALGICVLYLCHLWRKKRRTV